MCSSEFVEPPKPAPAQPKKCMVHYAVEAAAVRTMSAEERDAEPTKVSENFCAKAVENRKKAPSRTEISHYFLGESWTCLFASETASIRLRRRKHACAVAQARQSCPRGPLAELAITHRFLRASGDRKCRAQ